LDKTAPTGGVSGGTRINDTTVLLNFKGTDVGAGIDKYQVFVSENNSGYYDLGYVDKDTLRFTGEFDSTYSFYAIPSDSVNNYAPKGSADYSITFKPNSLPLLLTNFSGQYIDGINKLTATITDAVNVKTVELQRSADGYHFNFLGNVATGPAIGGTYNYDDKTPYAGKNYYRLRIVDNDGRLSFSNIVLLDNGGLLRVNVYPNPFRDNVQLQFANAKAGTYSLTISDLTGRKIKTASFTLSQGSQAVNLPLSGCASGTYIAAVTDASGNIVLNKKLIKL
jgi:hypothetical protein